MNQILLALAVVLTNSALGITLICNKCSHTTKDLEDQKCKNSTESCSTGYCKTESYTLKDGTKVVRRGCAKADDPCPDGYDKACGVLDKHLGLESCAGACCRKNNCNNFTPSNATGSSLQCNYCFYSGEEMEDQKCENSIVECSSGYCLTVALTKENGTKFFQRGCAATHSPCPNQDKICEILGSDVKCDVCTYSPNTPTAKRNCTTVDCPVGNCYELTYTGADGIEVVERGCDGLNYCADISKTCTDRKKQMKLKSCKGSCCKTDNCNVDKDDGGKKDDDGERNDDGQEDDGSKKDESGRKDDDGKEDDGSTKNIAGKKYDSGKKDGGSKKDVDAKKDDSGKKNEGGKKEVTRIKGDVGNKRNNSNSAIGIMTTKFTFFVIIISGDLAVFLSRISALVYTL